MGAPGGPTAGGELERQVVAGKREALVAAAAQRALELLAAEPLAERLMAGLDEGLPSLSLPILVYMCNPCGDNK